MSDEVKETKKCFIISAIGEPNSDHRKHFLWLMAHIIKPALSKFPEYEHLSSFDIQTPGIISAQIVGRLLDDDLVIADMTFLNANVFYEMGIRHHRAKPIIHMMRKNPDYKIPFDVSQYRTIEYDMDYPADLELASLQLANQIEETGKPGYRVSNPVTQTRDNLEIVSNGTDVDRALLKRIEDVESSILSLKRLSGRYFPRRGSGEIRLLDPSQPQLAGLTGNVVEARVDFRNLTYAQFKKLIRDYIGSNSLNHPLLGWNDEKNQGIIKVGAGWDAEKLAQLMQVLQIEDELGGSPE